MAMHVTFRQLRLFLALADTGSVSGAARATHVTQPTASMQLRELTESIGMPLYEVISRRVHLTDVGRDLAETVRRITNEWDGFAQRIDARQGLMRGRLSIAVVSTAKYFVPRILGTFCQRYPDIDAALVVLNRDGVVERLQQNLDDLYIMSQPPADMDLEDRVFLANPLVLIAPEHHPLAGRTQVTAADLAAESFVMRERGSGTRMACERHFKTLGIKPRVRLELGSNEAVKQAVAGGLGLAVVSVHSLDEHLPEQGICQLSAEGFPIESQWHIVRPRGKRHTPVGDAFERHLEEATAALRIAHIGLAPTPVEIYGSAAAPAVESAPRARSSAG